MFDWFVNLKKRKHLLAGVSAILLLTILIASPRPSTAMQNREPEATAFYTSFAQKNNEDTAAKLFRSGRNFIEEEKWQEAERSFKELLANHPRSRDTAAAL